MKHIVKQNEPRAFTEWKALANDDWQPTYGDLSGPTKKSVKDALMSEQGYLCCYCERRLAENDSHIEHLRPQCDSLVDPLDFGNLLCSCQNQLNKGEPRHCGNRKDDWFDHHLLISPLDPDCENRFSYTGDGIIKPAAHGDQAAVETINRLGLDLPKLNSLRAMAIEPFLDGVLSQEEMRLFVAGYLEIDKEGCFSEYFTTIRYLFGGFADA